MRICDVCGVYYHASARQCFNCGHEFPINHKTSAAAYTDELIKQEEPPKIEIFKVDFIAYDKVEGKAQKLPMLKVSYTCGLRIISEYVCLEHDGFPRQKANAWWKKHTGVPAPLNVDDALDMLQTLQVPTHLRVWTNKPGRYPTEIKDHCFDGFAFGTLDVAVQAAEVVQHEAYTDDLDI